MADTWPDDEIVLSFGRQTVKQALVGRDEPILDPGIPIIDAHHHLFLRPTVRYLLDDYVADITAGHRVIASVYVETQAFARTDGPALLRPVGEVEFANGMGAMADSGLFGPARICAAIVGYADMRLGDEVGRLLDRCMQTAPERFRGVRQITLDHESPLPWAYTPVRPPVGVMENPAFRDAFRHLGPRGLIFDAAVFDHQLAEICDLADAFPETTITINHAGMAMGMGVEGAARDDLFHLWRQRLAEVARRPNVFCKVGGFGLPFWGFGLEHRDDPIGYRELADLWRPWVETAVELFGPSRCMAESNYPPDRRSCGYVPLWNALKSIVSGMSETEKSDFFWRTAARVHQIEVPEHLIA
jgi:L-fuconolactonase